MSVYSLDTRSRTPYGARAFGSVVARRGFFKGVAIMAEDESTPSITGLHERIEAARKREAETVDQGPGRRRPTEGMALGLRLATELVAGIIVGGGVGYALDRVVGTAPWLMVMFLLLGGVAGVMNAYRVGRGLDATVGLGAAQRRKAERQKDR